MRAMALHAMAMLLALATAGCGGTGGPAEANSAVGTTTLSCQTAVPFAGPQPHGALPTKLFPAAASDAAADGPLPAALAAQLDQQVRDLLAKTGAPAITAALTVPGLGRWSSTQGLARVQPAQPVTAGTDFYWGSVAKTLTAVLVLQLVEEGKLSLDDAVARWFPQIPQAQYITVARLLSHTSGLQTNANSTSGLGADPPAEQAALLASMPLLFCPGTNASYSNAGYLLLALVVESVEQRPFYQSVQQRIAGPLGLQNLRGLRPGEGAPVALATPHDRQTPVPDPNAWTRLGAGNVVARAEDMVVFWQAVLSGRLLRPASVQSQWSVLHALGPQTAESNQGVQWFGKGVMLTEWTDGVRRPRTWLGHFGGIPTANAALLYDPVAEAYVAVAVNSAVSSAAVANALLATVEAWRTQP